MHRPKPFGDDSIPAGNGVAAHALQRLGWLLADDPGAFNFLDMPLRVRDLPEAVPQLNRFTDADLGDSVEQAIEVSGDVETQLDLAP